MSKISDTHPENHAFSFGDGAAAIAGCVGGVIGGIALGAVIAWVIVPEWSVTSMIVVFHITLAMIAMGAWAAPSLLAKLESEEAVAPRPELAPLDPPAGSGVQRAGSSSRDSATVDYRADREIQP